MKLYLSTCARGCGLIAIAASLLAADGAIAQVLSDVQASDDITLLQLPEPISLRDIDEYVTVLTVSEAQAAQMHRLHGDYLERYQELAQAVIPQFYQNGTHLLETGNELREALAGGTTREFVAAIQKHVRDYHHIAAQIAALDSTLFAEISLMLADEQLELLPLVQHRRMRQRSTISLPDIPDVRIPGAQVDLARLVDSIGLEEDEFANVRTHLVEYELVIGPLIEHRLRERVNHLARGERLRAEHWPFDAEALEKRRRMRAGLVRHDLRIKRLNESYLALVSTKLNDDRRRDLADAFAETAYTHLTFPANFRESVYPDVARRKLIEFARQTPRSAEDWLGDERTLQLFHQAIAEYETRYERVRRDLHRTIDDWEREFQAAFYADVNKRQEYLDRIKSLLDQRNALHEQTWAIIRPLVEAGLTADEVKAAP